MKQICAIYTRKSTEERLDMAFNSLDAQREGCEAYILSQKSEGWVASVTEYDDGGYSGGTLERPALNRLLDDIRAGKINIVVVYKIDRLTRSLMDFAKLVEVFDAHGVTFVSITQSFNTTTSMGRLTLNVLLSFAQFEREVAGERIRDKIAASKRKGMWMGGVAPIGYRIENRQLVVNQDEVPVVRMLFERYVALGSVSALKQELDGKRIKTPIRTSLKGYTCGGTSFSRGKLYEVLKNPAYTGLIRHKDQTYEGLHTGIIDPALWQRAQDILEDNRTQRTERTEQRYMLQGLIFDPDGVLYSPTFTKRHNRQYRYYLAQNLLQLKAHPNGLIARLPAHEIETLVERTLRERLMAWVDEDQEMMAYIERNAMTIATHDLIRNCVRKLVIERDRVKFEFTPQGLSKVLGHHLKIRTAITQASDVMEVPYCMAKGKRGAVVIEPERQCDDPFDLPEDRLRKLAQGIIWRDEHFGGMTLKDIAIREKCSEGHVGKTIFTSFDILKTALL